MILQFTKYATQPCPNQLVALLWILYLLFNLTVASFLHDIKSLFRLTKPCLRLFHVFEYLLDALFQLGRGWDLGWHKPCLVRIGFDCLDPFVQVNRGAIKVSRHILYKELSLFFLERFVIGDLVVEARSKPILGGLWVNRLLVNWQQLLSFNLVFLLLLRDVWRESGSWLRLEARIKVDPSIWLLTIRHKTASTGLIWLLNAKYAVTLCLLNSAPAKDWSRRRLPKDRGVAWRARRHLCDAYHRPLLVHRCLAK